MKKLTRSLILICALNPFAPLCLTRATAQQEQQAKSLAQMRAEIKVLEAVERNPETLAEVLELNRKFIVAKRKQLRTALVRRKNALSNYLTTVGSSLEEREIQAVQTSIAALENESRQLTAQLNAVNEAAVTEAASSNASSDFTRARRAPANVPLADATTNFSQPEFSNHVSGSDRSRSDVQLAQAIQIENTERETRFARVMAQRLRASDNVDSQQPACPACLPNIAPDETKDFIISAATGETNGKTRFKRNDRARIILINKNPFLYQYRVTLEERVIAEPAIGEFLSFLPFVSEAINPKPARQGGEDTESDFTDSACNDPRVTEQFRLLSSLQTELSGTDLTLRREFSINFEMPYNQTTNALEAATKILYSETASCQTLCDTATALRLDLQSFDPNFSDFNLRITTFKFQAQTFQSKFNELIADPNFSEACRRSRNEQVKLWRALAVYYLGSATKLEKDLAKIIENQKNFANMIKNINDVLAQPNAFYEVYTRGEFSLPTDIDIKVERKNLVAENANFVTLLENQTINFGGGARFALAGGVVGSPFETFNFVRVPALINGEKTTIVGVDRSSSSRILPIVMLHGRLFDLSRTNYFLDAIHLSLGVTAKSNDEGTNVEYLVGPSLSFLEGRMFMTFGGYGGRTQRLEGNLTVGAELPEDFTEELPVSQRFVWKPGFSLTYKIK